MREENYSPGTECTRRYAIKAASQVALSAPEGSRLCSSNEVQRLRIPL
jgi:hypothetical protein